MRQTTIRTRENRPAFIVFADNLGRASLTWDFPISSGFPLLERRLLRFVACCCQLGSPREILGGSRCTKRGRPDESPRAPRQAQAWCFDEGQLADQNALASKSATSSTSPQFRWQDVFLHQHRADLPSGPETSSASPPTLLHSAPLRAGPVVSTCGERSRTMPGGFPPPAPKQPGSRLPPGGLRH